VLVTGPNGAGKTNLLESLHVGTQGFSPRTRTDAQVLRFGTDAGRVALQGLRGRSRVELEVMFQLGEGKRAKLNGAPLRSAEQLRLEIATLVFTPDRLAVVKGGPAVRRAYFDRVSGRLTPARASLSVEYAATLAQRNAALRRVAAGFSSREALVPWTERIANLGRLLVEARVETIATLAPGFAERAEELRLPRARLVYMGEPPDAEALEARLDRDLERAELGAGSTELLAFEYAFTMHDLPYRLIRVTAGGLANIIASEGGDQANLLIMERTKRKLLDPHLKTRQLDAEPSERGVQPFAFGVYLINWEPEE